MLATLEPLFAGERERRLDSMEQAARALGDAGTDAARVRAATSLARDAHSLKGAAQMEARQQSVIAALATAVEAKKGDDAAVHLTAWLEAVAPRRHIRESAA